MPERLHKILARHGLGSRREIERWIVEGRITVNRRPAQIGDVLNDGDRVAIDGKEVTARLAVQVPAQALIYHKPQGQPIAHSALSRNASSDAESRMQPGSVDDNRDDRDPSNEAFGEAVMDRLPAIRGSRWLPINPMHPGDSGLLLVTNDGELSHALTRRKRWIPTAFMVRVLAPRAETPPEIGLHVSYDTGKGIENVEFSKVEAMGGEASNLWYRVESPRADQRAAVRALFESRDLKVSRMTQVDFGGIELPRDLPRGRHRALSPEQLAKLYRLAQLREPQAPGPVVKGRAAPDRRSSGRAPRSKKSSGLKSRGPARKHH